MNNEFTERDAINPDYLERDFDMAYTNESNRTLTIEEFCDQYEAEPETDATEILVGRITRMNDFGAIAFADIQDDTSTVQVVFREDDDASQLTVGDYIEVAGFPMMTDNEEFSIEAEVWEVLTPVAREVPTQTGLGERERARDRVGAMIVDENLRDSIQTRFDVINACRDYLSGAGYQEVQTPMLHYNASGASATPFETHAETIDDDMYLRIAPELYLKRLVMGGFEQIFEIGRNFRNEDADTSHNPEFTMMELYSAHSDYEDMMELTENLVAYIIEETTGSMVVEYDGHTIDFTPPWDRIQFVPAINRAVDSDILELSDEELCQLAANETGETIDTPAEAYDELYEEYVESDIVQPTFVIDHPRELTPLCSTHDDDDRLTERFEAVVAGIEISNSYSELTNPVEQFQRFSEQEDTTETDFGFADDLAYGMPPTGGLGVGLDRVAMLAAEETSIREVLPFPITSAQS